MALRRFKILPSWAGDEHARSTSVDAPPVEWVGKEFSAYQFSHSKKSVWFRLSHPNLIEKHGAGIGKGYMIPTRHVQWLGESEIPVPGAKVKEDLIQPGWYIKYHTSNTYAKINSIADHSNGAKLVALCNPDGSWSRLANFSWFQRNPGSYTVLSDTQYKCELDPSYKELHDKLIAQTSFNQKLVNENFELKKQVQLDNDQSLKMRNLQEAVSIARERAREDANAIKRLRARVAELELLNEGFGDSRVCGNDRELGFFCTQRENHAGPCRVDSVAPLQDQERILRLQNEPVLATNQANERIACSSFKFSAIQTGIRWGTALVFGLGALSYLV